MSGVDFMIGCIVISLGVYFGLAAMADAIRASMYQYLRDKEGGPRG